MSTPVYQARKVGGKYTVEPSDTGQSGELSWTLLAGGGLILAAIARRGLSGIVLSAIGGALLYCAFTDASHGGGGPDEPEGRSPNSREQGSADIVDEASMESFPASDPPAMRGGRA